MRRTVVFGFDGVIHSYSSKWMTATDIPGPPVPGIKEVITQIRDHGYDVIVSSSRCRHEKGKEAVVRWLSDNYIQVDGVTFTKTPADVYVDDRAICFDGNCEGLVDRILTLEPYWMYPEAVRNSISSFLEDKWHTEPPPCNPSYYLVTYDDGRMDVAFWNNTMYFGSDPIVGDYRWMYKAQYAKVVAWRPLPESYEFQK